MNHCVTDSSDPPLWERALPAMTLRAQSIAGKARSHRHQDQGDEGPGLVRPLLVSALIHGLALLAFVWFGFPTRTPPALPETLAIQLRIAAPAVQTAAPPVETGPARDEPERIIDQGPVSPPQTEPVRPAPETIAPAREPAPLQLSPERPALRLLTQESLREAIDGIVERRAIDDAWIDCTFLQRQSGIIDCGEGEDTRDFSVLERNATREFFTQRDVPRTRTQRTIGFMASRADDIEQQLLSTDLGGPAVERFLRELRATAVDLPRSGNIPLQSLRDQMHANDATYQQQQRAFNPR